MMALTQEFFGTADPETQRADVTPLSPEAAAQQWSAAIRDFFAYFDVLVEARRAEPRDDLASIVAWLTGGDLARAATACRHLREVADTDIPRVAAAARTLLDTGTTAEPPASAIPHATATAPAAPSVPVPPSHQARTLTGHDGVVWGAAFGPGGQLLATTSGDKTARLWDPATGECLRTLTGHDRVVAGVAFRPDGQLLATAEFAR